eukprot:CAMPEP_0113724580 /NCGR_PEP_ID=MMETSP0038_2-20120614/39176_1 /TAXON_ID=2898 /ORGANISM="Cryptomonas paramecium" /LENGTH=624 /DNA_ID=CAMNT_0000654533 /DNA_START=78 /DNA_END=1953 /DNA_ORIENTATION=- /assembly_acc=CAM_ASM_000170
MTCEAVKSTAIITITHSNIPPFLHRDMCEQKPRIGGVKDAAGAPKKLNLTVGQRLTVAFRWTVGAFLFVNFMVLWAGPVFIQGQVWKMGANKYLRMVFSLLDDNKYLRKFAEKYVYSKEVYTDFFAISVTLAMSAISSVCFLFYWQITYGTLPMWLIILYYFEWVGLGGRGMGCAYTFAHKEGHHRNGGIYKPWFANIFGNFWENWMGCWYGNVPNSFSTSHMFLHHHLNGGKGDTFYQFDLDRTSLNDLFLFLFRIFDHMIGTGSLRAFKILGQDGSRIFAENHDILWRGMFWYWVTVPTFIISVLVFAGNCGVGQIAWFMWFVYLQPLFGMTFFLAFMNFALHGFVEFGPENEHIACVNSTLIVEGEDDSFGEDDHMAHHYYGNVTHRDLPKHHETQKEEWVTFFLAFMNFALHGFVEFGPENEHIACVNSTLIVEGEDDSFGEDDHMAHHYYGNVTHRDLPKHHETQKEEWARHVGSAADFDQPIGGGEVLKSFAAPCGQPQTPNLNARSCVCVRGHAQKEEWARHVGSVFRCLAIPELAALILLQKWELLAEKHFIDHSGKLSKCEIVALLKERAVRKEMSYEEYEFEYLPKFRDHAMALVSSGKCANVMAAYKYLAHHK